MAATKPDDLATALGQIGLRWAAEHLDDVIALATRKRWGLPRLLEHIAEHELGERTQRSLERRLSRSRIGRFKPVADFDWRWPKKLDRALVESALRLCFMDRTGNIVLVAAQGLGKTMLAKNIAHNAVVAGHNTRFVTASDLLLDLAACESARTLERRLRYWSSVKLLVLDELGYLSYDSRNADLLFQVVSRRYENKSLVLTTNLAFSDWPSIFPNAACTTALIDRIVHHADVIAIEGDSYRRREAASKTQARRTANQ
ncbi:MAG: IS21-like element helper ATPase IstB [Myxococcales bacterium]|nr:IS21-like element helper ATPase IstB [Myxococcales bacterium]